MYPDDDIIFANGGDRNKENIPEMSVEGINLNLVLVEMIKKFLILDIKKMAII